MDCPKCQQRATGEDIDTEIPAWMSKLGKQAAAAAKVAGAKAAEMASKGFEATKKGSVAAAHASVAALKAAKKKYDEHTTPGQAEPKQEDDGRKKLRDHVAKCIKDAQQACADLKATHNDTTTEEQKNTLKQYEDEISAIVSALGTILKSVQ